MPTAYISAPPDDDANSAQVADALSGGYRHVVFADTNTVFRGTINLNSYPNLGPLLLEGAGPHLTTLNRAFEGGPLFSGGAGWTISMRGLHFWGASDETVPGPRGPVWRYTSPDSLCHFTDFERVDLLLCAFDRSVGTGLRLDCTSAGSAGTAYVEDCFIVNNHALETGTPYRGGAVFQDVGEVTVIDGIIERNCRDRQGTGHTDGAGLYVVGTGIRQPHGLLRGLHCELNGAHGGWGVKLEGCTDIRILDGYFYYSKVWLATGSSHCLVENGAFWDPCQNPTFRERPQTLPPPRHPLRPRRSLR
jgi:hypothetical protein